MDGGTFSFSLEPHENISINLRGNWKSKQRKDGKRIHLPQGLREGDMHSTQSREDCGGGGAASEAPSPIQTGSAAGLFQVHIMGQQDSDRVCTEGRDRQGDR